VRVLFDYEGLGPDDLPLRRGQLVEVTADVPGTTDWLIGEVNGRSGMFPTAFTEAVEDKPAVPQRPSLPKARSLPPRDFRRSMPPVPLGHSPSRSTLNSTLDSGSEHDIDDGAALVSTPATPGTGTRSRAGSTARKPPPPPPSRRMTGGRSRSSTLSKTPLASDEDRSQGSGRSGQLSPARYAEARSPFDHSDDEAAPLSHGLGAMHLRSANGRARDCAVCGCGDFAQNVFKANGVCATCFHTH
jgi:hypothetical protein